MHGTSGVAPGAIAEQLRQSIEEMVAAPPIMPENATDTGFPARP